MRTLNGKRRWPYLLAGLAIGIWALHTWVLNRIGASIENALREETGYPAHIKKLSGVLPLGRFQGEGLGFKTRFGPLDSINWTFPEVRLDLRAFPFFSKVYAVEALDAPGIQWVLDAGSMGGRMEGDLTIRGTSETLPPELPEDTIWCEWVEFSTLAPAGSVNSRRIELPHRTTLEVSPFTLREGEPVLPFKFNFHAQLSQEVSGPRIVALGTQDQKESKIDARVGAYALDTESIDRFLVTATAFDSSLQSLRQQAGDWIQDGSYSFLVDFKATPSLVKGAVTLRMRNPRFGEGAKRQEITSKQSLRPFLESFERREDTIELGPLEFKEDLTNPVPEAWTQLGALLIAEILSEAPDAAIQTGVGLLRNLFKKD